jgi:hypothetical protein
VIDLSGSGEHLLDALPAHPSPTDDDMAHFKFSDWAELFFEWHRTVGSLAITFSFMRFESPAITRINRLKYTILVALLNRCGRLVMANLCLASDNRHDEVIGIINRSLHETAIKLMWLCQSRTSDRFRRFLSDGLKGDLELQGHIRKNILIRGFKIELESRMLRSIQNSISTSQMRVKSIRSTKKLPDLATMMKQAGLDDLNYVIVQRIGSHYVHGTWTGLLVQSLEPDKDGNPILKDRFNPPHPNQLMHSSLLLLLALRSFLSFAIKPAQRAEVVTIVNRYISELQRQNLVMASPDLVRAS